MTVTGPIPAKKPLRNFWNALKTVEVNRDLLELPEGVYILGEKDLGSRMMMRKVYKQLLRMSEALRKNGCKKLVVRGTPGTGKSWWLAFVMRLAAQRGLTVVLQHKRLNARFLFR